MIELKNALLGLFLIFIFTNCASAQPHAITFEITNQPNTEIILGTIKGDKFTPIDTIQPVNNTTKFNLPINTTTGIYRIILGQTTYAKVMNEPPQQLDFIYNNEDINLSTDFNYPVDSMMVIQSVENKIWYNYQKMEKVIENKLKIAEQELDYYREKNDNDNANITRSIELYNNLQNELNTLIDQIIELHPDLYATKLIKLCKEPFLDGNLSKEQRNQLFKSAYFNNLDFVDESLVNSDVYTKKVFKYLMSYAQQGLSRKQQEQEFKNAIDMIVTHTNQNEKVYEFILDYLVSGFEKLRMDNLITHIADKYSGTTCQTDEVTTFERKLLQQKMKVGTIVPDFTLNDVNGDSVRLQEVLKDKNLILFWASWCPHCDEMIPEILRWQKSLNSTNFAVIAISVDDLEKDWKDKLFALGIEGWYNFSSLKKWECPVVLDYNIYATPTMFVIDQNRKITGKPFGLKELKSITQE